MPPRNTFGTNVGTLKRNSRSSIMAHPIPNENRIEIRGFYWPRLAGGADVSLTKAIKKGKKRPYKVSRHDPRQYPVMELIRSVAEKPSCANSESRQPIPNMAGDEVALNRSPLTGKPVHCRKIHTNASLLLPGKPLRKRLRQSTEESAGTETTIDF